jgi:hypothetical protein
VKLRSRLAVIAIYLLFAVMPAGAQAASANMLVHIHPQEYSHSIKLWQYYYDYWFEQGPVVEPIAIAMLSEAYGDVHMCVPGSEGRALLWIKPRMYYNPQMKYFYAEIHATAFTSKGEALSSYIGEAKKEGFLDILPGKQVPVVYQMAMQDLLTKMREDQQLKILATNGESNADAATVCGSLISNSRPSTMDLNYFFKRVK